MKRFEYMTNGTIEKKLDNWRGNYEELLNKLGAEGWEIMPQPDRGGYFAKREIIDEAAPQRTVRREMEYSRA